MDVSTRKRKTCLALSGSQESSMEGDPPKTSTQKSILSVIINHDNKIMKIIVDMMVSRNMRECVFVKTIIKVMMMRNAEN